MLRTSIQRNALVGCLLCLLLGTSFAFAQTGTTSLRGTVTEESGASVVGAQIVLSSKKQGIRRDMETNESGEYEFRALPRESLA